MDTFNDIYTFNITQEKSIQQSVSFNYMYKQTNKIKQIVQQFIIKRFIPL